MIRKDRAIKHSKEDILRRENFVHGFVQYVDGYVSSGNSKLSDSLVIGLQGSWGSGKTSLINLIAEEMQSHGYSKRYVVIRLDAWTSLDRESLLLEFFRTLFSTTLYQDDFDKASAVNIVKDLLQKNAHYISKAVSKLSAHLLEGVDLSEKVIKDFLFHESFEKKKGKVTKALENFPKTIIYFIDDIDRLSDEEVVFLFRLIKSIADFPNVIYILSYDYDVVTDALNRIQQGKGDKYLKKIIQVPFDVPRPSQEILCEYCTIGMIISLHLDEGKRGSYMVLVRNIILPYLRTLRDCNRFLNVLSLRYQVYGKDINLTDLIGLTVLELFDKHTYDIIYENKEIFYENRDKKASNTELSQKLNLEKIGQSSRQIIDLMFPGLLSSQNISDNGLLRTIFIPVVHPIRQEENFNLYFQMHTSAKQATWNDIHDTLQSLSIEKMLERFLYWQTNNLWWDVADQINKSYSMTREDRTLCIDKTKCINILKAITQMEEHLDFVERTSVQDNLVFGIMPILKNVLVNDKKIDVDFLVTLMNDEEITLNFASEIIHFLSEGKKWDPWHRNEWGVQSNAEINEEEFNRIKKCFVKRVRESIDNKKIFSLGGCSNLLNCIWMIKPDIIKSYLARLSDDNSSKEPMTIGIMMCVYCLSYPVANKIYWKKHPERWKIINDVDMASSVFDEYWTKDRIKNQTEGMKLYINAVKRLFRQEEVLLEEIR